MPGTRVIARYPYTDAEGHLIRRVVRLEPKGFRPEHRVPGSDDHWLPGRGPGPDVLYRLPEVQAECKRHGTIVDVEGEKDADTGRHRGLVTTTNEGGADGWRPTLASQLAGAGRVVVVADRDADGKGVRAAQQRANAIAEYVADVRLIEFPGAKDLFDWFQGGHSVEEFDSLIERTPRWGSSWPELIPLDETYVRPKFPVDALPDWAGRWVLATAAETQTPEDMAAMLLLAVLSACAGRCVVICVAPGWTEPANLFVVVVAESGERKTGVFNPAVTPLVDWEKHRISEEFPMHSKEATRRDVAERRAEHLRGKAAKSDDPGERAKLEEAASAASKSAFEIHVPPLPRLLADDVTPEAVTALLADHGGRLAVLSAEGGFFGTLAGRYSNGVPNLDAVNKGHTGEMIRVDRRSRPPEYIDRPAITLGLAVQSDVLRATRNVPELRNRGFLARILYSVPTSAIGMRSTHAPAVPPDVSFAYSTAISDIADGS